ncbi:MAG: hypothetical protein ACR2HQ_07980 [Ilumatobacteraceae bacterium]
MSMTPPPPPGAQPQPLQQPGPPGSGYTPIPPPPSSSVPPHVTWGQTKPPPPPCPIGAWLMIAGGVVIVIGCALPWFTILDETVNGFSDFGNDEASDGYVFTVLAVIVAAFGITTLAAKRLLPIAILAVVFASFAVVGVLADLGDLADLSDVFDISIGVGLPVALIGSLAALAGGIVALATRRR